ncbi:Tubulin--tyrosine ligase-like protein 12 [Chionoecetes opilio]|uniref:Tubulin--tyrosine ligase-like protein 12 n=1 Tax=Chionoecetes opilio TaxID=41210 RepID=A0A8J4Y5D0_CHIOP|nr:Tubulin--tyrosine ligase-like protein 12 [Chionoecetes opilio]
MAECNGLDKTFLEHHKQQLRTSGVPAHFWPTLFKKLLAQVYDAGECFQLCQLTYSEGDSDQGDPLWRVIVIRPEGVKASNPDHVFIIDHAWSYRAREARQCLVEIPGLLERMVGLMDIPREENTQEEIVEKVMREMWKYNSTYSIAGKSAEESLPVWYIMDEFGARIQHCAEPSFRVVPFYFSPHQCCYSLLFPVQDVDEGEEVTRNYVEGPPMDSLTLEALLLPWSAEDVTHVDPRQEEPPSDFFLGGRINETMAVESVEAADLPSHRPLKIYAQYAYVRNYLTDARFAVTESREEADILWLMEHFKDFKSLRENPSCRVNQYPFEHLITIKDLQAVVCRRAGRLGGREGEADSPAWLPLTFCLKRELMKFASLYQRREKRGEDNHWIIKPWNLARGLDHTITNNLNHIIAQKYISDPVLFLREDIDVKVKFDIRYIVMLLSVKPLKI